MLFYSFPGITLGRYILCSVNLAKNVFGDKYVFFEINHNIPYDKSVNAMGTNAYKPFANKKMNPINFYYSSIIGQCKEMSNHGSAKSCPDLNKLKIWTKYYVREI